MKKSKQAEKETKKETCPKKTSSNNDYIDLNEDDLDPLSDTTDFKSLLTQSIDISKTMVKNVAELKASHDLFVLDTNKLGLSLKCQAFYKNFLDDQDFKVNDYFDKDLIELFDLKENANKEKFMQSQFKNLKIDDEAKIQADDKIILKPVETKEQNIDDWLDELID